MNIAKKDLKAIHFKLYEYLKTYCIGEINAVPMNHLSEVLNVTPRQLQELVFQLICHKHGKTIITSNSKGYFIPLDEVEAHKSKGLFKKRLKSILKRYIASYGYDVDWIYNDLKELKDEYVAPAQNQEMIEFTKGQKTIVNYVGKNITHSKSKPYDNLFEYALDHALIRE